MFNEFTSIIHIGMQSPRCDSDFFKDFSRERLKIYPLFYLLLCLSVSGDLK